MQSFSLGRRLAAIAALTAFSLPMVLPRVALADDAVDPNAPGVARISIAQGSVAVQRGDSAQPVEAAVNAPVLGADYITTGDGSRAEVQFDEVSSVRLGDNVQMRFTKIDPNDRELQLAEGTVEARLLRGDDGSVTVDTPSISIRAQDGGAYRVSVDPDGRTSVTVRDGVAQILTPQGQQTLQPGTTLVASGTASDPQIDTTQAIAMDGFDSFNEDCDSHEQVALQDTHVAPDVQGVADLDNDGRWVDDSASGYGDAWVPSDVPADWAPYRDGRWVWEDAYGWTWVGAEPWGWAPYHYGRWYRSAAYGWCWYPGPRAYTPWAPAYVAFFGFNLGGVGIDLGFGDVGWLPIGPREAFHPWWGGGYAFRDVAVLGFDAISGYRNFRWGVTSVTRENFLAGRFGAHVAVSPERLRDARFTSGRLALVPTTANLRYTDRSASVRVSPRTTFAERSFAGHAQPVARVPFSEARTAVAAGRAIERPALPATAAAGYAGRAATTSREGYANEQRSGYANEQRSGYAAQREAGSSASARADVTARGSSDVWSRFNASRGTGAAYGRGTTSDGAYERGTTYDRTTTNRGVETYDGSRQTGGTASRVPAYDGSRTGTQQRSWTSSPSYGTQRSSDAQRSYSQPSYSTQRSYSQPSYGAQRSYSPPSYGTERSYSQPSYGTQRSYSQPSYGAQRSYSQPSYGTQRSYSQPSYGTQRSYSQPSYGAQRSYSRPSYNRSYSAPSRSYSAPSRSYSSPQRSASAQSRGTSRSSSSSDTRTHH